MAAGARYDKYSTDSLFDSGVLGGQESSFERDVIALFNEILVPLFDQGNSSQGLERLILTASLRYEDYNDVGSTTNPKVGVLWTPIKGLDIRGTWGKSFRAPDLQELDEITNFTVIFPIADPSSPTGVIFSLFHLGNNSNLKNETAKTWTAGFDYSSPSLPGLALDMTYYNIKFNNRITSAANSFSSILIQEDKFASAILRNPSQADIDEACSLGDLFVDFGFGPCATTPVSAIIDLRLINTAVTRTDGFDFNVRYVLETEGYGRFNFHVGGTYILSFDEAFGPTAPAVALVNLVANPIGLRLRNSMTWSSQNGWSASAFLNYSDSYTDNVSSPERKIDSWTTIDLTLSYSTVDGLRSVGLNNALLSLSVRNLFDTDPPFVNNVLGVGYDPENASPLGRFISFSITKTW